MKINGTTNPNRTLRKALIWLGALVSSGAVALSAVITYAAYLTFSNNHLALQYQTDAMVSTYFQAGSGSQSSPYQISTPAQLRNLQKLTALGLFQQQTYFILANDIEWNNDPTPLLPIGSDDQPFFGTFDGRGHTISHLIVNGSETWDIGMFGYVDATATVKNFLLSAPTIIVGDSSYTGGADSTNPLHQYLKNYAPNLAEPAAPDSSGNAKSGYLSWTSSATSSTISGLDESITAPINGQNVSFPIEWTSSNTTRLHLSNGSWVTERDTELASSSLTQVMLTGRIFATINGRVCAYTVERYEFNILGSGAITTDTISLSSSDGQVTTSAIRGCFKTIWTSDGNGSTANFHGIYVGFFVGHLDGKANCLGLIGGNSFSASDNGRIIIQGRKAQSSTSLIGRSRGDDSRDGTGSNQYGHTFDFTNSQTSWVNYVAPGIKTADDIAEGRAGRFTKASDFTQQMALMRALTTAYGADTSSDPYKYMRIYPTAYHATDVSYTYDDGKGGVQHAENIQALRFTEGLAGQSYTAIETQNFLWPSYDKDADGNYINDINHDGEVNEKDITTSSPKANQVQYYLDTDLSHYSGSSIGRNSISNYNDYKNHDYYPGSYRYRQFYMYKPDDILYGDFDTSRFRENMNLVRKYCVSSGFWVYTKGDNTDLINTIMGNNIFDLTFKITYVATTTNTNKTANSWQVLYNAYNYQVCRYQPCRLGTYTYDDDRKFHGFIYQDSYLQNCQWYDLHHPKVGSNEIIILDDYGDRIYDNPPDDNSWMPYRDATPDEVGTIYDPDSFPIYADGQLHETTVSIHVNRTSSWWAAYYDAFFSNDTWYPCFAIGPGKTDSLEQDNDDYRVWNGPFQQDQTSYQNRGFSATGTKSQRGPNDGENHYYNSRFALDGDLQLNVLSFQSVFTNAYATTSDLTQNVDYIYDTSDSALHFDTTSDTFTHWNVASGVKVGFNIASAISTGNATYYYYREKGNSGASSLVHVGYNNASYPPTNDTKYSAATLEQVT